MATYRIIYKEDMSVTVGKKKFNTLQEMKDAVNSSSTFCLYDIKNTKKGLTAYMNRWTVRIATDGKAYKVVYNDKI